jgi:hypothetical protein
MSVVMVMVMVIVVIVMCMLGMNHCSFLTAERKDRQQDQLVHGILPAVQNERTKRTANPDKCVGSSSP